MYDPREALEMRRQQLAQILSAQREEIALDGAGGDDMERYEAHSRRETATHALDRTRLGLLEVEAALERARDGSYGICEDCGEGIAPVRLRALPWATVCVRCAERREGQR